MAPTSAHQYLDMEIKDDMQYDIRIENARIDSGEFHSASDENDTLTTDDVEDLMIRHNGGTRHVCSSGEEEGFKGLQGTIDLVDDVRDARICTLAWNAPMEPGKRNLLMMHHHDPQYNVEIGKWNESGVMGTVPITISNQ
ncbi:aegerolysin family protein [Aspergillus clavatus NRRL 1]|uniref:Asp hemolysin-like protein n=1 Tax=Aspergillus clavatus (strain ATCC 1007 / CBS 513.65 / DSM 816 / NCTC 3887 / NRRL 1 / QM 1276 / 107) TaxID=344612 RepID=A1CGD5_ASPCL|nr:uncharacterized protein ACLA_066510 [Aspergillus clavatus NRRL 1]EAW11015.1 hypothetical protein ACLA_066510 [Aspergillus clavatus NRRL 1]